MRETAIDQSASTRFDVKSPEKMIDVLPHPEGWGFLHAMLAPDDSRLRSMFA